MTNPTSMYRTHHLLGQVGVGLGDAPAPDLDLIRLKPRRLRPRGGLARRDADLLDGLGVACELVGVGVDG